MLCYADLVFELRRELPSIAAQVLQSITIHDCVHIDTAAFSFLTWSQLQKSTEHLPVTYQSLKPLVSTKLT